MSCLSPACTSSGTASTTSPAVRTRPARSSRWAVPSVSSAPDYYPDVDLLHRGELGDATLRLFQHLDETDRAARRAAHLPDHREAPDGRVPHPGLQPAQPAPVSARLDPVLQRLPIHLRVLRHPLPLRPQPAPENAAAGRPPNSTSWPTAAASPSTSSTTISSAIPKARWSCCRTSSSGRRRRDCQVRLSARPR